jgi:hypothetical protein
MNKIANSNVDCIFCDTKSTIKVCSGLCNTELEKYNEEEARIIWRAGQEYWKTSGDSITFEELTEKLKTKNPVKTKERIVSETSESTKQKAIDYGNYLATKEEPTIEEEYLKDELKKYDGIDVVVLNKPEEPKQETIEEVAYRLFSTMPSEISTSTAKSKALELAIWQQEIMYSEDGVTAIVKEAYELGIRGLSILDFEKWFNGIKKK